MQSLPSQKYVTCMPKVSRLNSVVCKTTIGDKLHGGQFWMPHSFILTVCLLCGTNMTSKISLHSLLSFLLVELLFFPIQWHFDDVHKDERASEH